MASQVVIGGKNHKIKTISMVDPIIVTLNQSQSVTSTYYGNKCVFGCVKLF